MRTTNCSYLLFALATLAVFAPVTSAKSDGASGIPDSARIALDEMYRGTPVAIDDSRLGNVPNHTTQEWGEMGIHIVTDEKGNRYLKAIPLKSAQLSDAQVVRIMELEKAKGEVEIAGPNVIYQSASCSVTESGVQLFSGSCTVHIDRNSVVPMLAFYPRAKVHGPFFIMWLSNSDNDRAEVKWNGPSPYASVANNALGTVTRQNNADTECWIGNTVKLCSSTDKSLSDEITELERCPDDLADITRRCAGVWISPSGIEYPGVFDRRYAKIRSRLGAAYEGGFNRGTLNGSGVATFPTGEKYVGDFKDGKFEGHGRLTYSNGTEYVGEFKNGQPSVRTKSDTSAAMQFSRYAVEINTSLKTKLPDFYGAQREYKNYRTRIRDAFKRGPDFAGTFSVIEIGCGTGCRWVLIGNNKTGEIMEFPRGGEENLALDLKYQLSSRLLIAQWSNYQKCMREYFIFDGSNFEVLKSQEVQASNYGTCPKTLAETLN